MDLFAPLRLGVRALNALHRVALALDAAVRVQPQVRGRIDRIEQRLDETIVGGDELRRSADALRATSEKLGASAA